MADKSQRPKGRDGVLSLLNVAIDGLNLAKELSSVTPAQAVFGSVSVLLTMIRDTMANEQDYVDLGLSCADICRALDRGVNGKKLDDLSKSVCDAINQLVMTVAEIQKRIIKQSGRNAVSRFLRARNDKETIVGWESDLNRILHVFNTELVLNTHIIVSDMHQNVLKLREDADSQNRVTESSTRGELPPPSPRILFGRAELIEKIVGFGERLKPIALIGPGGIGKTSTALTVLHDNRIKRRFGEDRRFIRCDKFPASLTHFLRRLSKAIGAGIENPEDLDPLRSFLSSKDMFIILDNAESVLDPQGTSAQEIYAVVEELSQLSNICLCITSRISDFPPECEWIDIPTLSMEAARDTFYRIYIHGDRSDLVNKILEELDFHPLSITLLATGARHNKWDTDRLAREWDERRTDVLQTDRNKSLAATIELSLSSPMFQKLGPSARHLLEVIAFFPQGVDENNLDWFFSTITDRKNIFDKFCVLSLTYRSDGFVTMLAPLRHYLSPRDPLSAPLLCSTKDHYFSRLSVDVEPGRPGFEEARWIVSEDVNVEHLLDVFTTADATSGGVWGACADFMKHLFWRKPRLVALGPKVEALPDDHPSKLECLLQLSRLFRMVGNNMGRERLLTHALKLSRERGNDHQLIRTLRQLSDMHWHMDLYKEGIQWAKEALEISERLSDTKERSYCLIDLAWLLREDGQLDAAEEAASRALNLLPEKDEQLQACGCHHTLGMIYHFKDETGKAIHHLEVALEVASSINCFNQQCRVHFSLASLFFDEAQFDDAHAHIEHAKRHAVNCHDTYLLSHAIWLQAKVWTRQRRFVEAKSGALCAVDMYEKLGAADDVKRVRDLLRQIDRVHELEEIDCPSTSNKSDDDDKATGLGR